MRVSLAPRWTRRGTARPQEATNERGAEKEEGHTGPESDVPFFAAGTARPPDGPTVSYLQAGSPSPAVVTCGFGVFTPIAQVKFMICECVTVADQ
jgi:hypothetical protein